MTDLEARIAKLEAIEAIKALKHKYFNACDAKEADVVRACFLDDATIDAGPMGRYESADAFIDLFKKAGCHPHIIDMHHGANPEIDIVSDDRATAVWALYFHTMNTDAQTYRQMAGRYFDAYEFVGGAWKIASSRFVPHSILDGSLAALGTGGNGS